MRVCTVSLFGMASRIHSQIVALKFIPKLGKSEDELQALQREIAIMRALRHDNIVALYDWLETDSEVKV